MIPDMAIPPLLPGDHLLYDVDKPWTSGFLCDWVIRVKTWSDVAHIEVYDGDNQSLAARAGGVDRYPFRTQGLKYVLRPQSWDADAARAYFRSVQGQKYDWKGLLCFTLAVSQGTPDRKFCSEFARNLDRAASLRSFHDLWPGDKTAPGSFKLSPAFVWIYAP